MSTGEGLVGRVEARVDDHVVIPDQSLTSYPSSGSTRTRSGPRGRDRLCSTGARLDLPDRSTAGTRSRLLMILGLGDGHTPKSMATHALGIGGFRAAVPHGARVAVPQLDNDRDGVLPIPHREAGRRSAVAASWGFGLQRRGEGPGEAGRRVGQRPRGWQRGEHLLALEDG